MMKNHFHLCPDTGRQIKYFIADMQDSACGKWNLILLETK